MVKKILIITVFTFLLTSFTYPNQGEDMPIYLKMTGTLVEKFEQGNNDFYNIEDENGNPVSLVVTQDTYILNETDIEIGDSISGYFPVNIPVIAIYPPQYPIDVLVKNDDFFATKYDVFNENYLSSDRGLVINVSNEETEIVDRSGNEYKESIIDKPIIVIYSITTKSLPPQTSPEKIIVLSDEDEDSFISDESYEFNDNVSKISVKTPIVNFDDNDEEQLINDSINYLVQKMYDEQVKANEEYKEAFIATGGTEESYLPVEVIIDYEILSLDENFLSIKLFKHQTLANAYNESYYLNYDIKNAQLLTINDIADTDFVKTEIVRMASFRTEEMPSKYNYNMDVIENITIDYNTKFYINEDENLVVVFDKYEIASGADGEQTFIIPNSSNYIYNGLDGYYPLSNIAKILGYKVAWLDDVRTVSVSMDDMSILIPVDENTIIVDDSEIKMEKSPVIYNDKTYVDYEYISLLVK